MLPSLLAGVLAALVTLTAPADGNHKTSAEPGRLNLLGLQVCLTGASGAEPCHLRVFPPPKDRPVTEPPPLPLQVRLLGKSVCLGPVPDEAACDLRLGNAQSTTPPDTAV